MKWIAMGLGIAVLALAVSAFALTKRNASPGTNGLVTTPQSSPIDALIPAISGKPRQPSSGSGDNQAGDTNTGDRSGDNQAGDTNTGDRSGDNQAGDTNSGDSSGDNQAGDTKNSGD
jgi:hypothetical protein